MAADDSDEDDLLAEAMEGASDEELLDEDFVCVCVCVCVGVCVCVRGL